MALVLKMQINEQPENQYVFSTGDGGQIELIPLSVVANGSYSAPDGKAYNLVTVNVPDTELESLNITENGTYNAPDGTAYNVVTVNVEPILEAVSRTYSANGTYTIQPSEGSDGISSVTVVVNVPTGGGGDVVTVYKRFTPSADDTVYTIDLSADKPQNKQLTGFIIRPALGTWQSISNSGGRWLVLYYTATRDIDDSTKWYKTWLYKSTASPITTQMGNGGSKTAMNVTPQSNIVSNAVGYDDINEAIKVICRSFDSTTTNKYGFASYCPYELFAFYK